MDGYQANKMDLQDVLIDCVVYVANAMNLTLIESMKATLQ